MLYVNYTSIKQILEDLKEGKHIQKLKLYYLLLFLIFKIPHKA